MQHSLEGNLAAPVQCARACWGFDANSGGSGGEVLQCDLCDGATATGTETQSGAAQRARGGSIAVLLEHTVPLRGDDDCRRRSGGRGGEEAEARSTPGEQKQSTEH